MITETGDKRSEALVMRALLTAAAATFVFCAAAVAHAKEQEETRDGVSGNSSRVRQDTAQSDASDVLSSLNAGAMLILDPGVGVSDYEAYLRQNHIEAGEGISQAADSSLVMANVQNVLNIRKDPDENSEKVGFLYKDCGGSILEQQDGWTKLKSGSVIGWAKDEYLLFGEEAEALANDVGNLIVTIHTDALRVRKEPSLAAGVFGLVAADDELDVLEQLNENWISVDFEGETGYVSAEYVELDFHIDEGETVEAVRVREKAEAEAKAKAAKEKAAAFISAADDTRLLGALVQCEAGNQPYEGQLAVAAVVMNRVKSSGYPNSISSVIYASGQFTPALNGKVAKTYEKGVRESCMQAAREAMAGATNVGAATHFKRVGAHEGMVIGAHVFW